MYSISMIVSLLFILPLTTHGCFCPTSSRGITAAVNIKGGKVPFILVEEEEEEQTSCRGEVVSCDESRLQRDRSTTRSERGIKFDPAWLRGPGNFDVSLGSSDLPSFLPNPTFVRVYEYKEDEERNDDNDRISDDERGKLSLEELGAAARKLVDSTSSRMAGGGGGAVLFRNLHHRIRNAHDFASFWRGCLKDDTGWKEMTYDNFGRPRIQQNGIDLATNIPAESVLPCHNEMSYNPKPAGRIAFFCLQDAEEGGETLIAKNADMTRYVRKEVQDYVRKHGGVLYLREYYDRSNAGSVGNAEPWGMSWQEKCGKEKREEAFEYFTRLGFADDDIHFDKNGTMTIKYIHSGFISDDSRSGENKDVWFNILQTGFIKLGDGSTLPLEILSMLRIDEWKAVHALKLKPGDWLVLNNKAFLHGRLPYKDNPDSPRRILTVYTE